MYGEWRIASPFLTSTLDRVSGHLHASNALLLGKELRYSLDRGYLSRRSRLEAGGKEKLFAPAIPILTEPSQLCLNVTSLIYYCGLSSCGHWSSS
jgi:hypothetical protein